MNSFTLNKEALRKLPKKQREEAEQLLRIYRHHAENNPLVTTSVENYQKQHDFLKATELRKAFFGGNGAGKTFVGLLDDIIQAVPREFVPPHLLQYKRWEPPFYCRIICPKWNVAGAVIEKLREIVPKEALKGQNFDEAFNKQDMKLRFECGSWFIFNTADQDRDAHAAIELHRAHFDEEPPGQKGFGIYTENVARLRRYMPHAQVMFTMTPLLGLSWTFDEIWEKRDQDNTFCVVASMRDNPHIDAEAMIEALSHLSDAEKEAIIEGRFVSFTGLVMREFSDENIIPQVDPKFSSRQDFTLISIDPGISQAAVTWNGFDPDNTQTVFDEYYPKDEKAHVDQMASVIKAKNLLWGIRNPMYVIDPAAKNRMLTDGATVETLFAREGIHTMRGNNDKQAGFMEIKARAQHQKLKVTENCVNVLHEQKRWTIARDETMTERENTTFTTRGPHHTWDTIRYASMYRPWISRPQIIPHKKEVWTPNHAPARLTVMQEEFPLGSMS